MNNLSPKYVVIIKCNFKYLKKYSNLRIIYKKRNFLLFHSYIDSNWVINLITWYLTTGYFYTLVGDIINVFLKYQYLVTLFSIKTKYIAYCKIIKKTIWLWLLLKKLGYL